MLNYICFDPGVINDDGTKDYVDNDPDVIDMEPVSEPVQEAPAEDIQSALFGGDGQ